MSDYKNAVDFMLSGVPCVHAVDTVCHRTFHEGYDLKLVDATQPFGSLRDEIYSRGPVFVFANDDNSPNCMGEFRDDELSNCHRKAFFAPDHASALKLIDEVHEFIVTHNHSSVLIAY